MRTSTSNNYLTTGIAYAFHPHPATPGIRAPMCPDQLGGCRSSTSNPAMRWRSIPTTSAAVSRTTPTPTNYQEWNAKMRFNAADFVGEDPRPQPHAPGAAAARAQDGGGDAAWRNAALLGDPGFLRPFRTRPARSPVLDSTGSASACTFVFGISRSAPAAPRNVDSKCTGSARSTEPTCRAARLNHVPGREVQVTVPIRKPVEPVQPSGAGAPL